MKIEVGAAKAKAEKERIKGERAMKSLRNALSKNVILKQSIIEEKERHSAEAKKSTATSSKGQISDPMEVETTPATPMAETTVITPIPPVGVTRRNIQP